MTTTRTRFGNQLMPVHDRVKERTSTRGGWLWCETFFYTILKSDSFHIIKKFSLRSFFCRASCLSSTPFSLFVNITYFNVFTFFFLFILSLFILLACTYRHHSHRYLSYHTLCINTVCTHNISLILITPIQSDHIFPLVHNHLFNITLWLTTPVHQLPATPCSLVSSPWPVSSSTGTCPQQRSSAPNRLPS